MSRYRAGQVTRRNKMMLEWGVVIVFIGVIIGAIIYHNRTPLIPIKVQNEANFAIFYPNSNNQIRVEKNTIKYNTSLGQVSYIVDFAGKKITFAEQTEPVSFTADPTFYTSFVENLRGYASFDSINGHVDLTFPGQVNSQTAVMVTKGTLLFAKASGNISELNWRFLFNDLNFTQPK
jgi:hypothetical protein